MAIHKKGFNRRRKVCRLIYLIDGIICPWKPVTERKKPEEAMEIYAYYILFIGVTIVALGVLGVIFAKHLS